MVSNSDAEIAKIFPVFDSDSIEYATLAENINNYYVFSISTAEPFSPETFRTPGYPIFVANILTLTGSYYAVIVFQILIVFFSSVIIFFIGRELLSERWALVPAVLYIFDPATIVNSLIIMSDSLFVFLFLLCIYLLFMYKNSWWKYLLAGVVISAAIYVRPVGIYTPFFLIPLLYVVKKMHFKYFAQAAVLFVIPLIIFLTPWFVRNYIQEGKMGFSSVTSYNLFYYNVPQFIKFTDKIPESQTINRFLQESNLTVAEARMLRNKDILSSVALPYIKNNFIKYLAFHLYTSIKGGAITSSLKASAIFMHQIKGNAQQEPERFIYTLERLAWLVVCILSLASLIFAKGQRLLLVCCICFLYFIITLGPVGYARYRMPASPFIFIAATTVLVRLKVRYNTFYYARTNR
jgi:4-amino-4-deoxy-L-arabinose transferase-like glycosyltransferase